MARYSLAASAAFAALIIAAPAAAKDRHAHHPVQAAMQLQPTYEELQAKIDELSQTVVDLSDRLAAVEDALGDPDNQDSNADDGSVDGLDLARAQGSHRPLQLHRPSRTTQHHVSPENNGSAGAMKATSEHAT